MITITISRDTAVEEMREFNELFMARGIYDDVEDLQHRVGVLETKMVTNIVTGEEVETNEQFNGKTVYCKAVDVGTLPNAGNKNVATGLDMSVINAVRIEGIAKNSNGTTIPLPNATPNNTYAIGCFLTAGGNVQIGTNIDRSDYTGIVRIYYTKEV